MKTRRQKLDEEQAKVEAKSKRKPTKAELLQQKEDAQKAKKGKSIGAKKIKIDTVSVSVKSDAKKAETKISVKAVKKQKEARVKISPRGKSARITSKSSVSIDQVNITKKNEPKPKTKTSKSVEPVPEKQKEAPKPKQKKKKSPSKKEPSPEPLPRKKPEVAEEEKKENVKTMIMKGKVPIDEFFPLRKQDYHVLQVADKVYSATLNQTNVMNNNNKFYIIQILQSDTNAGICYLFMRWGRVGVTGQTSNMGPYNPMHAMAEYSKKYHEKAIKGDYREIELNYENEDEKKDQDNKADGKDTTTQAEQTLKKVQSKLPKSVQSLIQLIFDLNMMNKQMVQIGYNVDKMPLGKLSKDNIKRGYQKLKQLYEELKGRRRQAQIVRLTNDFYSIIPHDFGFTHMSNFLLDSQPKVKQKIQMLEALTEIKVATTILNEGKKDQNKIDSNYSKLNRNISPVDRATDQFKVIHQYLQTTHGKHHTSYSLDIVDLFRVESQMQSARYTKDLHNKKLLWHGSRLTNFVGILSQGLRIAPPQAPVTGYMFGKGVYFADMSSKSANYCFTSRENNTGILLLCEVALGNMNQKTHADYYAANLPENKHSTKGVGKIEPDPKKATCFDFDKEVEIPMGPSIQSSDPKFYLRYNEFIVYDIAQIKIRYLLRLKFNYNNNAVAIW